MPAAPFAPPAETGADPGSRIVLELAPTPAVPRNSEGAFATLRDGRILYTYTQYYGGDEDHSAARLAEITSSDGGRTWSEPRVVVAGVDGRGLNVMSLSLLRLASGRLARFHLLTRSPVDCRPWLSYSADDGATWTEPRLLLPDPGYYVLNNDRVIQTRTGRLVMPMNVHARAWARGEAVWFYSDDEGATWTASPSRWSLAEGNAGLQESGVVETPGGALLSWFRTDRGCQYESRSTDDGATWSAPQPGGLASPLSPASIKRRPGTNELVAVFNDHSGRFPFVAGMRTPLALAVSADDGATWPARRLLEADTRRWYHYAALHFTADALLLAYNAGDDIMGKFRSPLRLRRVELAWLPRPA
ncbi:MAG: exo-alpha-sialidase [Opitutaceae bacterium]|nr:exo-alpha-sialidase [Opitutaceae bacterium]